jgi:CelD/BcsL family acetyltransferase involved in cellulose biosynthesis
MMEQVIDRDRVTALDFLTGNEGYKQDWMSERRERTRLVITRHAAGNTRPTGIARLRNWLS